MTQASTSLSAEQVVTPSAEPASPESPEDRYVRQFNLMLKDAIECHSVESLTDTLAWGLAIIATQCGIEVAGDIVRRLGGHIGSIAARDRAEAEAEQARMQGRAFQ